MAVEWIYLSPHLDDAALSCGGLIAAQAARGLAVEIWTVCSGDPPEGPLSPFAESLHRRWEGEPEAPGVSPGSRQVYAQRRAEDRLSCTRLGAASWHAGLCDCIYRRSPRSGEFLYASEESLSSTIHPDELSLVEDLRSQLATRFALQQAASPDAVWLVCPLALGGHVDHRLVRAAAERLELPLLYYADFPYALKAAAALEALERAGWACIEASLSPDSLQAWEEGVAAHVSQISSFWENAQTMRQAIYDYSAGMNGLHIWQRTSDYTNPSILLHLP